MHVIISELNKIECSSTTKAMKKFFPLYNIMARCLSEYLRTIVEINIHKVRSDKKASVHHRN